MKRIKYLVLSVLISTTSILNVAYAEQRLDLGYCTNNKIWNIKFNLPVDSSTFKDSIKVYDQYNNLVDVDLIRQNDYTVSVKPKYSYNYYTKYRITINKSLRGQNNKYIFDSYTMYFEPKEVCLNYTVKLLNQELNLKTITLNQSTFDKAKKYKLEGVDEFLVFGESYNLIIPDSCKIYLYDENEKLIYTGIINTYSTINYTKTYYEAIK